MENTYITDYSGTIERRELKLTPIVISDEEIYFLADEVMRATGHKGRVSQIIENNDLYDDAIEYVELIGKTKTVGYPTVQNLNTFIQQFNRKVTSTKFITEEGVYELIFKSKKPELKELKRHYLSVIRQALSNNNTSTENVDDSKELLLAKLTAEKDQALLEMNLAIANLEFKTTLLETLGKN